MLIDLPLSRTKLDRSAHLRSDSGALDALWAKARIVELIGDRFLTEGNALAFVPPTVAGERYFLGVDGAGIPYFVAHRRAENVEYPEEFKTLRTLGSHLDELQIGIAVHALAL